MELQPSSVSLLTSFILLFLLAVVTLQKRYNHSRGSAGPKLPPGPRKLPLIGNLHNIIFGPLPHRKLRDLSDKYGRLMHLQLGEASVVVVSSAEFAREVLKTHGLASASKSTILASKIAFYDSTDVIFSPYGEYWRQVRKMCTLKMLSAKRVKSFRWIREEEVRNFVAGLSIAGSRPVNLTRGLYSLAYSITSRTVFGEKLFKSQKEVHLMIDLVAELVKLTSGFNIVEAFPSFPWLSVLSGTTARLENIHRQIDEMLENIINERRRELALGSSAGQVEETDSDLIIDALLKFEDQNDNTGFSMSTNNIKAVLFDMIAAGSDTSATKIDWAMAEMMKRPEIMKKAQAEVREAFDRREQVSEEDLHELKYLNSVIIETLRLHPAVPIIQREFQDECEIDGSKIPAKTKLMVNAWALGRDPHYWTEPETFNPERFLDNPIDYKGNNFQFIPFGAGQRNCPGMTFAIANVEFELAMLLYHLDWKFPEGMMNGQLDMAESFELTVKRKDDMFLIPIPYCPLKCYPKK